MIIALYIALSLMVGALFIIAALYDKLKRLEVAYEDLWEQVYGDRKWFTSECGNFRSRLLFANNRFMTQEEIDKRMDQMKAQSQFEDESG